MLDGSIVAAGGRQFAGGGGGGCIGFELVAVEVEGVFDLVAAGVAEGEAELEVEGFGDGGGDGAGPANRKATRRRIRGEAGDGVRAARGLSLPAPGGEVAGITR